VPKYSANSGYCCRTDQLEQLGLRVIEDFLSVFPSILSALFKQANKQTKKPAKTKNPTIKQKAL